MAVRELALYVSAATEMDAECELLGQLLAAMPRGIRWSIKRTPGPFDPLPLDLDALRESDFYLLLLGMDAVAPIGVEWREARQHVAQRYCYHCHTRTPSPSATHVLRNEGIRWTPYDTPQAFARHLELRLITELIQGTPGYGLDMDDIRALTERLAELENEAEGDATSTANDERRRGAGHGGVILRAPGG